MSIRHLLAKVPPGYERTKPWYEYLSAEDQEELKRLTSGLFADNNKSQKWPTTKNKTQP